MTQASDIDLTPADYEGPDPAILEDLDRLAEDAATIELIRRGLTMGCFYIESPAMRSLLKRMKCERFEEVVAASSVIRPGVAESGMMKTYIERHTGRAEVETVHPALAEILDETHGVMIYQEDVIKIAHLLGGLSLGEADLLRRAMSGKLRSRESMRDLTDRFFLSCRERGIDEEVIAEIWRQIESFAEYGFCKGHSAAFAVLSYQTAWLKSHYPAEFMAGVLTCDKDNTDNLTKFINETRSIGIPVLRPDVDESDAGFTVVDAPIATGSGGDQPDDEPPATAGAEPVVDEVARRGARVRVADEAPAEASGPVAADAADRVGCGRTCRIRWSAGIATALAASITRATSAGVTSFSLIATMPCELMLRMWLPAIPA